MEILEKRMFIVGMREVSLYDKDLTRCLRSVRGWCVGNVTDEEYGFYVKGSIGVPTKSTGS